MENHKDVPQKIKNITTTWSSSSTSEYLFKRIKNIFSMRYLHSLFTAALFTIAKRWKIPKCPSADEWIKQMGVYMCNRILFRIFLKEEILLWATTWVNLQDKISQLQIDKYCIIPLIESNWSSQSDRNRK